MTKENQEVTFHPSGMAAEILDDSSLSEAEKKRLLESLGPEVGEYIPKDNSDNLA